MIMTIKRTPPITPPMIPAKEDDDDAPDVVESTVSLDTETFTVAVTPGKPEDAREEIIVFVKDEEASAVVNDDMEDAGTLTDEVTSKFTVDKVPSSRRQDGQKTGVPEVQS